MLDLFRVGSPNGSPVLNVKKLVFEGIRSVPEVGTSNGSEENILQDLDLFKERNP
jgi:hypothetical protein